jgi:hypothetical protein
VKKLLYFRLTLHIFLLKTPLRLRTIFFWNNFNKMKSFRVFQVKNLNFRQNEQIFIYSFTSLICWFVMVALLLLHCDAVRWSFVLQWLEKVISILYLCSFWMLSYLFFLVSSILCFGYFCLSIIKLYLSELFDFRL